MKISGVTAIRTASQRFHCSFSKSRCSAGLGRGCGSLPLPPNSRGGPYFLLTPSVAASTHIRTARARVAHARPGMAVVTSKHLRPPPLRAVRVLPALQAAADPALPGLRSPGRLGLKALRPRAGASCPLGPAAPAGTTHALPGLLKRDHGDLQTSIRNSISKSRYRVLVVLVMTDQVFNSLGK